MPAFHINCSSYIQIDGGNINNCDIAIEAKDSSSISINGVNINNCDKGIRFENCWNSKITGLNINDDTRIGINRYRLNYLSILVKYFMEK